MTENEIEELEKAKAEIQRQISEKLTRIQEIEQEKQEIEKRRELINKYENAESSIKFCKKHLKLIVIGFIGIALGMIMTRNISLIKSIFLASVAAGLSIVCFGGEFIKDYFQANKVIKEISKEKYEEVKQNEEKDKEIKKSLTTESTKINQEIVPLKEELARYKKVEGMQNLGYQLELLISDFTLQNKSMKNNLTREDYEQLWDCYLETKKDYSKVYFNDPEVENAIKLEKKL